MSWQDRTPAIKLTIDKSLFNKLIGILDFNIKLQLEDENFSEIAKKLKEKLMTYSVPRKDENEIEFVDVRFFPNEASNMIWQLLARASSYIEQENYYEVLLKNYELKKNKNNNN